MKSITKILMVAFATALGTALFSSCATECTVTYRDYTSSSVYAYPHYYHYGGTYYWHSPYYTYHYRPVPPRPHHKPDPPKPNNHYSGTTPPKPNAPAPQATVRPPRQGNITGSIGGGRAPNPTGNRSSNTGTRSGSVSGTNTGTRR